MAWNYSNTSIQTTLSAPVASGDTSITIVDTTGLPVSFPFSLILDYNLATVEVVTVTNVVGSTLTVTRGQDGTSAQSHSSGGPVVHGVVARDLAEPQAHIAAISNIHGTGVGANVVGTSTVQTLTNKTISGSTNTITNVADSSILSIAASKVTQPFTTITASGLGTFGSLSVSGSSTLAAVTATTVQASGLATLQAGANVSGAAVSITRASAANPARDIQVTGDTNPRHRVLADGTHQWGPGNAATDTTLARTSSRELTSNAAFLLSTSSGTNDLIKVSVDGDTNARFFARGDGRLKWGDGTNSSDTFLYRNGVGVLKTEGDVQIGGNLVVTGVGSKVTARKTVDQSVNNTTTLTNDSNLAIAVVNGAVYEVHGLIIYNSNSTADLKLGWTFPGGSTGAFGMHGYDAGGTVFMADSRAISAVISYNGFGTDYTVLINGIFVAGANGSLQLQFAQNTANVSNTTLKANSFLSLTRI